MKKIISIENVKKIISKAKKKGKKLFFYATECLIYYTLDTINHFKAKNYGDILVVSVTSDKYVNKGPEDQLLTNTKEQML